MNTGLFYLQAVKIHSSASVETEEYRSLWGLCIFYEYKEGMESASEAFTFAFKQLFGILSG